MPTTTQHPNGIGGADAWTLGAGVDKVSAVASNDGDTSYISSTGGTQQELYTFPSLPTNAVSPVISCTWGAYCREANGGGIAFTALYDGSTWGGTTSHQNDAYSLQTQVHYSLVVSAINAAQGGVQCGNTGNVFAHCTEIYRQTAYNVGGASFLFFFSWLLPIIGAAIDFAQFRKALAYVPGTRFEHQEMTAAWREWKEWRRPCYSR